MGLPPNPTSQRHNVGRGVALLVLVAGLVGCGGTIYYGSSSPSPSPIKPSSTASIPSVLPSPPPGTTAGTLMAFDAKTGVSLWQSQAPMAAMDQPVVSGGLVFVVGGYGRSPSVLAAFKAMNGDLIWRAPVPFACGFPNTVAVGPAIVVTSGCAQAMGPPFSGQSMVHGVEPKTGRELWTAPGIAAVAGSGTALVIVQAPSGDFKVRGLDPLTGHQLWEARLTVTNIPPLVNGRVALVEGYGCPTSSPSLDIKGSNCTGPGQAGVFVSSLDPATGSQLWQVRFGQGSQLRRLLLGDVAVFSFDVETPPAPGQPPQAGPSAERLGALDLATGSELWRQTVTPEAVTPVLAAPGTVFIEQVHYVGGQQCTTRLDALDSKSGTLTWRLDNLQFCQATVAVDGPTTVLVLASLSTTRIVVLDTATGTKLWEKPIATPGPYPLVSASVSNGVVYVAASGRFIAAPGA
jgi:outer membrane protein assembly factor BamB